MKLFSYSIFLSFITTANSLGSATATTSRVNNSLRGGTRESEGSIAISKSSSMSSSTNRQLASQPILTPLQFCSQERDLDDSVVGCPQYEECEAQVCQQDMYCCETRWDSTCTDLAQEVFECACPANNPSLIVGPDVEFDNLYYTCDYDAQQIEFHHCPNNGKFNLSEYGGYCVS